jgi:hypothetical protein
MHWTKDESHPFAGIANKLDRADKSIYNLHLEIDAFFKESPHPSIPDVNSQEWQDAVEFHRDRPIPKRFSVLSGEIIHHFRSCLDHIAWHFASPADKAVDTTARRIEFPVYPEPLTKDQRATLKRKIEAFANPNVRKLIEDLQPRGDEAINDPICIVHDMDRFDKHRELAIVRSMVNLTFPPGMSATVLNHVIRQRNKESLSPDEFSLMQDAVKNDAKASPTVAFAQFGNREGQPVIPSLIVLLNAMDSVVDLFAVEV